MKKLLLAGTAAAIGALVGIATAVQAADGPPLWAYGYTTPVPAGFTPPPPNPPAQLDATTQHVLPGSPLKFTRAQIANRHGPADWFPGDHPAMPDIVSKGKSDANPPVFACGLCHYPNGKGRPENANVTGLNYDYIVQQLIDFRNGARKTSDPRKGNTGLMAGFAKNMTDDEIKVAATYFTAIPATQWIRVVETATVPKSRPVGGIWIPVTGAEAGVEPIGDRILESPENVEHAEVLRDPRSGFIAYVPTGSLKKGEDLVKNGVTSSGAKITACTVCHGSDLRGIGQAPTIAGRSPSYVARQLYDMKVGNRNGAWTPLMAPVVAGMGEADLLSASAYLASLRP